MPRDSSGITVICQKSRYGHDEKDAEIAGDSDSPSERTSIEGNSGEEAPGPDADLPEIVRLSDHAEQTR